MSAVRENVRMAEKKPHHRPGDLILDHYMPNATETEREDARVVVQRLAELAAEMNWPADAPAPEELIREDRDRR